MVTSAALYHMLHFFHITIDIRNVCVFLAPLFSSFTAIVTYHFTKELKVRLLCSVLLVYKSHNVGCVSFFSCFFTPLFDRMLALDFLPLP